MITTTCPVPGCDRTKPSTHLMCKGHWAMVPKDLRDEVWSAWKLRQKHADRFGPHVRAKAAALAAVRDAGAPPQAELGLSLPLND